MGGSEALQGLFCNNVPELVSFLSHITYFSGHLSSVGYGKWCDFFPVYSAYGVSDSLCLVLPLPTVSTKILRACQYPQVYILVFLVCKHGRGFRCDSWSLSQGVGHDPGEQVELFVVFGTIVVFFWLGCGSLVPSSFPTLIWLPSRSFSLIITVSSPASSWTSCCSVPWWCCSSYTSP